MQPARGMAPTRSYPWAQVSLSARNSTLAGKSPEYLAVVTAPSGDPARY